MLEGIRMARQMYQIPLDPEDDYGFLAHAKTTFNHKFHRMNTEYHTLALFLHPQCRKLAIENAAKAQSFDQVCKTALMIAKKWEWGLDRAQKLIDDLKQYHQCKGVFVGGQADAKDWWSSLGVQASQHPLKTLALIIHSIVPHSAEVERLFSGLGGVQGRKRVRLTVDNFERLGKLRARYCEEISERIGLPLHRKHAHMHTRDSPGINSALADDLEQTFSFTPPLHVPSVASNGDEGNLEGPESITEEEIDGWFTELESDTAAAASEVTPGVVDQLARTEDTGVDEVFSFTELARVEKGLAPTSFEEDMDIQTSRGGENAAGWDVGSLLASKGVV